MYTDFFPSLPRITGHVTNKCAVLESEMPPAVTHILDAMDIASAHHEIGQWEGYIPTPLRDLSGLKAELGLGELWYKDESSRFGLGSFKALGGAYAVLRLLQRFLTEQSGRAVKASELRTGALDSSVRNLTVVTATDGNHGRSVAWSARQFGCRAVIYIHANVSHGREQTLTDLGAEVIRVAGNYDDSVREALDAARANGWFLVPDTSLGGYANVAVDVMAGYTMISHEIAASLAASLPPTHLFVQAGVGGLAAALGIHSWHLWGRHRPRLIVVEPDVADCLYASARAGQPIASEGSLDTIMAGLSCGQVSPIAWEVLRVAAHEFVTLPDDIVGPMVRLLHSGKAGDVSIVSGESGVAGLACVVAVMADEQLAKNFGLDATSRVIVIGTEGATDPAIFNRMIAESNGVPVSISPNS